MDSNGLRRIVSMLKRIGTIKKEKYMETNKSVGTVDYLSPPKPGKDQWFMPVVLDQSGTKIKFYCKFDPQVQVGDKVLVHYGQERNGNATAFKVEAPDKDINEDTTDAKPVSVPQPTEKEIGMIAVGLAGRITELFCQLHHDKGIQMKDTADEIAKWIGHGITAYEKAMDTRKKLQSMVNENKTWDELDEKPF
jgi:hypothetical protein